MTYRHASELICDPLQGLVELVRGVFDLLQAHVKCNRKSKG
jgi:hypothetical protein